MYMHMPRKRGSVVASRSERIARPNRLLTRGANESDGKVEGSTVDRVIRATVRNTQLIARWAPHFGATFVAGESQSGK